MAVKSSSKSPSKDFQKAQFVNYDLTKSDKASLAKNEFTLAGLAEEMEGYLRDGYKISLSWDKYSDCPACWLIPMEETHRNYGAILTSRASNPVKALIALFFKDKSVFKGMWADRSLGPHETDDF